MGMFDNIKVEQGVDLPFWPEELDHTSFDWQSKSLKRGLDTYKITAEGRLLRKEHEYREKTDEEKQAEAEKWGFDSWDEYVQAYEENEEPLFPDSVDYDEDADEEYPPVFPKERVLDETWWADHNMHGTVTFYASGKRIEDAPDVFFEYEARFNKGELTDLVFMGERGGRNVDDPIGDALDKIEEWQEDG